MQDLITIITLILSSTMSSTIAIWYRIGRLEEKVKNLNGKFRYLNRRLNNLESHLKESR